MLGRMTMAEKIGALNTETPAIASLELDPYNWWSEATHGISHIRNDDSTPLESNFAFPITTAMSFNRSLWKATGEQIGVEGRAFMNAGNAWSTFWAPVINLAREPRWGRNIETFAQGGSNCWRTAPHTPLQRIIRALRHDRVAS